MAEKVMKFKNLRYLLLFARSCDEVNTPFRMAPKTLGMTCVRSINEQKRRSDNRKPCPLQPFGRNVRIEEDERWMGAGMIVNLWSSRGIKGKPSESMRRRRDWIPQEFLGQSPTNSIFCSCLSQTS